MYARPEFKAYTTVMFHFYFQQPSSCKDVWFSRRKVTKVNNNVMEFSKLSPARQLKKTLAAVLLTGGILQWVEI
jgi:hypothetical protein